MCAPPRLFRRAFLAAPALIALPARAQGGTLYLTIDTGWMSEAELIVAALNRHQVRATLFLADERTFRGDTCLSDSWGGFWRARADEGHGFASHTMRHWYFRADPAPGKVLFQSYDRRQSAVLDQAALCTELNGPGERLRAMTGREMLTGLWRAPGGITTPNALRMAAACGFTRHVGWSQAGFLGDELPSDRYPNRMLLDRALKAIRDGDVLVLHWGIRSRAEKFGQVVEPLLAGLVARGFRFATLEPAPA